jgi:hypothetical protein
VSVQRCDLDHVAVAAAAGEAGEHGRIVAGHDLGAGLAGQLPELVKGPVHLRQVRDHRGRPVALEFLVIVHRVRRDHRAAGRGRHCRHGLPGSVPADLQQLDPWRRGVAGLEQRQAAVGVDPPQFADVRRLGRPGELAARSERAGPELVLAAGHDDLGRREGVQVADVVVVPVRRHHLGDRGRVDAEPGERRDGCERRRAATPPPGARRKAGVDQDRAP